MDMTSNSLESNFTSIKPTVQFVGLEDLYFFNENLTIKYKFNDYTPQEGDRLAIFKLGWTYVKDYILFEWAPITASSNNSEYVVVFNKNVLPKVTEEMYQVCYIGSENEIHGASSLFQFSSSKPLTQSTSTFVSMSSSTKSTHICNSMNKDNNSVDKDLEIRGLKEEVVMLKESLKAVIAMNHGSSLRDYDNDIKELREMFESLKKTSSLQQTEINMLKSKIAERDDEYKQINLVKNEIEKKYEKLKNSIHDFMATDGGVKGCNNLNVCKSCDLGELMSIPPFPSDIKYLCSD